MPEWAPITAASTNLLECSSRERHHTPTPLDWAARAATERTSGQHRVPMLSAAAVLKIWPIIRRSSRPRWRWRQSRTSRTAARSFSTVFCGSASTLLAAENTGRRGRGIEIDPIYLDVGVKRWQKLTGKAATLDGDGRSFDEIRLARALTVEAGNG